MFTPLSSKITAWGALVTFGCFPMVLDGDQPASSADKLPGAAILGQIVSSSGAVLNGVTALADSTLIAGSTLKTADHGTALVAFSADTRATLGERTSATFQRKAGRVIAELSSGTIAAQASGNGVLALETPNLLIEPAGAGPAVYALAMLPNHNTEVDARRGPVRITEKASGESYMLKEGYHAQVAGQDQSSQRPEPETAPGPPPSQQPEPETARGPTSGQQKKKASHTGLIILLVAAGAGAGIAAAASGGGGGSSQPTSPSAP